jgi:alpha-beta hydrolase superfamily lysophospholipase
MKKINFKSKDGLKITADYYKIENHKGFIVLCHRSHCNRAEYRETAPKFNKLGYSCLAIDQRSGMKIFGETNETKNRAKEQGFSTGYLDAKPDIESAIDYTFALNGNKPIILLGSSYSSALALLISANSDKIKSVIVFSPNEYLKKINLAEQIKNINIPIFATSAKKEIYQVSEVLKFVDKKYITHFKPKFEGFHGSKTIWKVVKGYETYWKAIENFLIKTT